MNLLFFSIIILPLIDAISRCFVIDEKMQNAASKFIIFSFFAILIALYNKLHAPLSLDIIDLEPNLNLGFLLDKNNLKIILSLTFVTIATNFYVEKFAHFVKNFDLWQFKLFLAILLFLINLIILSKTALALLLSYNLLLLFCYFLLTKFWFKNHDKKSKIFIFLLFAEVFLLLFAIIITAKFGDGVAFNNSGLLNNVSAFKTNLLFALYFGAIFLTILTSSNLLFYKNCAADLPISYLVMPLFIGVSKVYILIKIIYEIFGIGIFSSLIAKINIEFLAIIFLVNLAISLGLLLFSKNFKTIFFHLFFSQLLVALFSIIIFAIYDEVNIYKVLHNFIFSITLTFFTFSSLILYLKNAQNKDLSGLFYNMKVTNSLFLFGLLNFAAVVPAVLMFEKISLLKIAFANNLFFAKIFFILNSIAILFFAIKLFFPLLLKVENLEKLKHDYELAKKIDSASSLILSAVMLAIIIFILAIF